MSRTQFPIARALAVLVLAGVLAAPPAPSRVGATPKSVENPAALIYAGWFGNTIPTPSFIAANHDFLETQPFDGLVVYLRKTSINVNLTLSVMKDTAISYDTMMTVLGPMAALNFTNLTENLGLIMGSTPPDFFDDWSVVIQNWANLARAAKDSGLKGICFDNEQYHAPWGNYSSTTKYAATKTLAEYEVQARLRGKQVMEAMVAEFPDLVFMTLHGPYVSEPDAPSALKFPQWQSSNELLGPFFAGNMEGAGTTACCIDGGELYTLRTQSEFDASASWRRNQLPSDAVNCSFIPAALRTVWPDRTNISFGVYDVAWGGASMNTTILRSTLANSMRAADRYVWFYAEAATYLLAPDAGGASASWVEAISLARADVAASANPAPSGPPAAPTSLAATAVTTTSVTLGWTDNASNENGFAIQRLIGSTWTQIGSTPDSNITTFTNTGLNPGTSYSYRVLAFNGGGNSATTNTATATTASLAAAAPTNLVATAVTTTSVSLGWTDNASNENGFSIERLNGSTWSQVAWVADNVTTYTQTGLDPATEYSYRVLAFNGGGNSATTNAVTVTTQSLTPAAPTNLAATSVTSSSVTLGWTDNSSNENGFAIQRLDGSTWTQIGSTPDSNITTFTNTGLNPGTAYSYRVLAFNSYGNSATTFVVTATTSSTPADPTNLAATAVTTTSVTLGWTDNASNENGYAIERLIGSTWTQVGNTPDSNITTFTNTGLNPGTSYSYRVLAFNGFGNSDVSNTATVTTTSANQPPAAPSGLTAVVVSNHVVDLAWTDNSGNENGFAIERRRSGGEWSQVATVAAGVVKFRDKGRTRDITYVYRVRAFNGSGNSAYTADARVTMP